MQDDGQAAFEREKRRAEHAQTSGGDGIERCGVGQAGDAQAGHDRLLDGFDLAQFQ